MNWTEQELKEHERKQAAVGFTAALSGLAEQLAEKPKPPRNPAVPKWNKTEARYAEQLEGQRLTGLMRWWLFEGMTFKLAPDTRYTPDFVAMTKDGGLECYEVKGAKRGKPRYEDDARVKIAVAAEKFRPIRFFMVWPLPRSFDWGVKEF